MSSLTGAQSQIDLHPIIAVRGASQVNLFDVVPSLTNAKLFKRDRYTCAYCGDVHLRGLTRDHIIPTSKGGGDIWQNVASACKLLLPNFSLQRHACAKTRAKRTRRIGVLTGNSYEFKSLVGGFRTRLGVRS